MVTRSKASKKKSSKGVDFKALLKQRKGAKGKAQKSDVELPDGFKVVGRAPNMEWDLKKNNLLEGERGETREVVFNEGSKKEYVARCCIVVSEELGAVTLWESAGLRDFFDQTEEGQIVRVKFTKELKPMKKGQQGMKVFECAAKDAD